MARRTHKQPRRFLKLQIVFYVLVAIGLGYGLTLVVNEPFLALDELNTATYLDNANSLRGNAYKFSGTIANALAWSPEEGRLVSVETGDNVLPVLIPVSFNSMNIQKGQAYQFSVEILDKGIIRAKDLQKK